MSGGILAALSFEPIGAGWLTPLAMALLWVGVARRSLRSAAWSGLCFGIVFMLILLWWLVDSIGWGAWLALAGVLAIVIGVAGVGIRAVAALPAGPVWAAAVWVAAESVRSAWPLGGMPWGRLGFTAIDTPWQPLLPYAGISGTGLLIAVAGFGAAHACDLLTGRARPGPWRPRPLRGRGLVAILAGVGAAAMAAAGWPYLSAADATATVAAVQGGVPGDGRDLAGHHREVTRNHVTATIALTEHLTPEQRASLDFVVWPENATAVDPILDPVAREGIEEAAIAIGVPVLIGGIFDGPSPDTAYNRSIVWPPGNSPAAGREIDPRLAYTKTHLVPFGEYIPWRSMISDWFSRLERIPRDMLPGDGEGPLSVGGLLVADAICFDVAYDDVLSGQVARGAQLVVVQTSNATFTGTSQPEQQFEITRARAVELGRAVVVASTNGVSGVIAADGSVSQRTFDEKATTLVTEVSLADQVPPAVRTQAARSAAITVGAGLGLLLALARGRRGATSGCGDPAHEEDAGEDRHLIGS